MPTLYPTSNAIFEQRISGAEDARWFQTSTGKNASLGKHTIRSRSHDTFASRFCKQNFSVPSSVRFRSSR
ncbi:unnamed protein product [Periconia digitata]|uniref:Uncharacterized protein n=1 Tax=Periconia digitata TaxID=1303443 RepID=A0A9W4UDW0_9PLEO|nr:unnamed protein product [Periconia digitata]